jgi:hypothetical protein
VRLQLGQGPVDSGSPLVAFFDVGGGRVHGAFRLANSVPRGDGGLAGAVWALQLSSA